METDRTMIAAKRCMAAGRVAAESGNFADAVEQMEEALRLRPDFAPYWVSLGNFFRRQEEFQKSEDAIRKAIRISPTASYAWTELGLLFRDRGLFEKAADSLKKSSELRPDFNTYTILSAVELKFDADAALLSAEHALRLSPDWGEALDARDAAMEIIERRNDD